MLYEHKFECKTKGLVCGPIVLGTNNPMGSYVPVKLKKNKATIFDAKSVLTSAYHVTTYKIVIKSRETKEEIWTRAFATHGEAFLVWQRLIGLNEQYVGHERVYCPTVWMDGELEYVFALVVSFTATNTNNTLTWTNGGNLVPGGVTKTDYLCIGGGGGGGINDGGGGGAGGFTYATGFSVTPGASVTITVGASGAGSTSNADHGRDGTASTFSTVTSGYGGGGGNQTTGGKNGNAGGAGSGGGNGGNGGGAANNNGTGGSAGSPNGTAGGNSDNTNPSASPSGGGGGSSSAGGAGTGSTAGAGGTGTSNSISGSSVTYSTGGNGCIVGAGAPSNATANTGNGGNGAAQTGNGGAGATGIIIVSYTPADGRAHV